jgi:ABC-type enterobactin transport system permease subunit
MDTLGYIGTSTELNAISTHVLIQFWFSEELSLGILKTGSVISTSWPLTTLSATTVFFSLVRL